MTRPISFDNISARLQGFESTRLHENDWRNVVEYVEQLERTIQNLLDNDENSEAYWQRIIEQRERQERWKKRQDGER